MKRFGIVATVAALVTAVGCGGGGSGGSTKSSASTAAGSTTTTTTTTTGTTTTTPRGSVTVSTGQSTTGTLKITVSPASAAVGAQVSITMSGIATGAAGVGMGLLDSTGNPVAVPTQSLNASNASELDFTVPSTANGAYSVLVQVVDANSKVLDQCMAPFTVGTGNGTTASTGVGATVTATSKTGTLTVAVTPGAAAAGAPVVVQCTNLDAGTVGFGIGMRDTAGNVTQVQGTLNQQTSSATSVELDITVPTLPAGVYVLDVQAGDQNGKLLDDVQLSFTINAGGTTATTTTAAVPAVTGANVMQPAGTLTFTCTPGGGAAGQTCTVTLSGVPTGTNNTFVCLFDQNNNEVDVTNLVAVSATQLTFQIPATAAGVYYLDAFALNGPVTSSSTSAIDNAESQFTVNGAAGSTSTTTAGAAGGASTTQLGTLVIESVSPGNAVAGATIELTLGGFTSGNLGIALLSNANPSAQPIVFQTVTPNTTTSTSTVLVLDMVVPAGTPSGSYELAVIDMGANYANLTAAQQQAAQPVGEAQIAFTVN